MEALIVAAIILILCFCLGMSLELIAIIFLIMLDTALLFIFGFFVYCLIRLFGSKRKTARFSRIDQRGKAPFKTAFYEIGGEEYPNALPAEFVAKRLFYSKAKNTTVFQCRNREVFDRNAVITVAFGLVLGSGGFVVLLTQIISIITLR